MKTLLVLVTIALSTSVFAETTTGTKPLGPRTLDQQSYPSSGPLRSRSNDITGKDMSNSTLMSSDVDPTVPKSMPTDQRQEEENEIQTGPYKNGKYQYLED